MCDVDGDAAGLTWVKRAPMGHKGAAHEERQAACDCSLAPLPARARGGTGVASCGSVPLSLSSCNSSGSQFGAR